MTLTCGSGGEGSLTSKFSKKIFLHFKAGAALYSLHSVSNSRTWHWAYKLWFGFDSSDSSEKNTEPNHYISPTKNRVKGLIRFGHGSAAEPKIDVRSFIV